MASSHPHHLRFVWVIFIVLYLFTMGFMIATLSTDKWIEIDPNSDDDFVYTVPPFPFLFEIEGESFAFKGSIYYITEGLSETRTYINLMPPRKALDLENEPYSKVGCGLCFVVDVTDEDFVDENIWDFYNSWCNFMKRLWFAAGFYITLEIFSLACVTAVIILCFLFLYDKYHARLAYIASGGIVVFHFLAILVWIGIANATFDDDGCDNLYYSDHTPPKVCAKAGPRLSLFILIFLPFVVVPFIIFVCYKNKKLSQSKIVEIKQGENSGREMSVKIEENDPGVGVQ